MEKKEVKRILLVFVLLFLCSRAEAAPSITVSASAVTLLGTGQQISITVQLIDPLNTGMLKVSGTGIVPIMRASTVTPGTTATVGPIYGNDVILNAFGNANTTYYQVQVFTVNAGGFLSFTPALQNFYAFTGSGTIDLSVALPLVPNFMNSTAGVSIPGNFSVSGATTTAGITNNGSMTNTGGITSNLINSNGASLPTHGFLRLDSGSSIVWHSTGSGHDIGYQIVSGVGNEPADTIELVDLTLDAGKFLLAGAFLSGATAPPTSLATGGAFRMSPADTIDWRNFALNADDILGRDAAGDSLVWNSDKVATLTATQNVTNKTFTGITPFPGNTAALTADWTCGTGGTVASCTSATIIGSGGGVPLTFTLPLVAQSYTLTCDGVVGQATAATANQWNLLTATNGVTNITANYTMATAATAYAAGAVTDQASTTTTFQISPSWTLGGTGTKMPFHVWAKIEGASASGTVVSLQLVAPTVGDLVTIYRGAACTIF